MKKQQYNHCQLAYIFKDLAHCDTHSCDAGLSANADRKDSNITN